MQIFQARPIFFDLSEQQEKLDAALSHAKSWPNDDLGIVINDERLQILFGEIQDTRSCRVLVDISLMCNYFPNICGS